MWRSWCLLSRTPVDSLIASVERRYVTELLRATRGRIGETTRRAGLNERALYALMKRHGLRKEDFKRSEPARANARPSKSSR
jgi:DNA-binding NtrC family response regulator